MAITYSININNGDELNVDQLLTDLNLEGHWTRLNDRCLVFHSDQNIGFELSILHNYHSTYIIELNEYIVLESYVSFGLRVDKSFDYVTMKKNLVTLINEVISLLSELKILVLQNAETEIAFYSSGILNVSDSGFWDSELESIISKETSNVKWKLIDE